MKAEFTKELFGQKLVDYLGFTYFNAMPFD